MRQLLQWEMMCPESPSCTITSPIALDDTRALMMSMVLVVRCTMSTARCRLVQLGWDPQ